MIWEQSRAVSIVIPRQLSAIYQELERELELKWNLRMSHFRIHNSSFTNRQKESQVAIPDFQESIQLQSKDLQGGSAAP